VELDNTAGVIAANVDRGRENIVSRPTAEATTKHGSERAKGSCGNTLSASIACNATKSPQPPKCITSSKFPSIELRCTTPTICCRYASPATPPAPQPVSDSATVRFCNKWGVWGVFLSCSKIHRPHPNRVDFFASFEGGAFASVAVNSWLARKLSKKLIENQTTTAILSKVTGIEYSSGLMINYHFCFCQTDNSETRSQLGC
jgi:hypothetical protein